MTEVYLYDELPRFGCGWRIVEILSLGPKWVRLRYAPRPMPGVTTPITATSRLKRAVWDGLATREIASC